MSGPFPPGASGASEPADLVPDFTSLSYTPPTPVHAAPAPGDEAIDQAAPAAEPPAHPYATPAYATPAYAVPVGGSAPRTYYLPETVPPLSSAQAGMTDGPPGAFPPPWPTAPAEPHAVEATRSRVLAVIALAFAVVGTLAALTGGTGFANLMLFTAFVLAVIALLRRRSRGKGIAVSALLLSLVAGFVSLAIGLAGLFGSVGSDTSYNDEYGSWGLQDEPSLDTAAPGTDGMPDPEAVFDAPVAPTVTATAFGRDSDGLWWYAVVVDNPNTDYIFDAPIDVHAIAADGSTTATESMFATLLSGETVLVGFLEPDRGDVASITVELPPASYATVSPASETGAFTTADASATTADGITTVRGIVSGAFAQDQEYVEISVIVRAVDGTIVAASTDYVERVPRDGTPVPFEAYIWDEIPTDATVQAYAHQ